MPVSMGPLPLLWIPPPVSVSAPVYMCLSAVVSVCASVSGVRVRWTTLRLLSCGMGRERGKEGGKRNRDAHNVTS